MVVGPFPLVDSIGKCWEVVVFGSAGKAVPVVIAGRPDTRD